MGYRTPTIINYTMKRLLLITLLFTNAVCFAQVKLTMTFTPKNDPGHVITANMASLIKGIYAFNDYTCYWFINPHTNLHHFVLQLNNKAGLGPTFLSTAIELNSTQNDFEFWDHPHPNSDSNFLAINKAYSIVSAPIEYDEPSLGGTTNHNESMKVHISTFTASEIEFTINGNAEYGTKEGDGKFLGYGAVEIHGHFYRQGSYEKSPVYPGCNCDPTIYAERYDDEEGDARTASECEAIMLNKIFNATKLALAPINNAAFSGQGKVPAGQWFTRLHNHADVSGQVPAKPEWPFVYNYKATIKRNELALHTAYHNDDRFGIEMDEMPDDSKTNALQDNHNAEQANLMQTMQSMGLKEKQAKIDSLGQLMKDKKITMQQYSDQLQKIMAPATASMNAGIKKGNDISASGPDVKQMNMESQMHIQININPDADYFVPLYEEVISSAVQVLHTVAGAAYVIRTNAVKDGDGNWSGNKCIVLLGKFKQPTVHSQGTYSNAVNSPAVYPAAPNKLLVYNIAIQMDGGKDQIEKALATLDFAAFESILTPQ